MTPPPYRDLPPGELPVALVTNDDGIDSDGLHAVVEAITPHCRVIVVAPDRNRSAVSRSITLGETLEVVESEVPGAEVALATSGTPTDCVRMAVLELAGEGLKPHLVVSGANRGLNVGDDVTYSGTVAAAFEGAMNGLPAIAISQQSLEGELGYPRTDDFDWTAMRGFLGTLVPELLEHWPSLPDGLVLNVNVPGVMPDDVQGVEVVDLGRRIYRDQLTLRDEDGTGRRRYTLYGDDPEHHADETGTDIAVLGNDVIAVTPLRFDLVTREVMDAVRGWDLPATSGS